MSWGCNKIKTKTGGLLNFHARKFKLHVEVLKGSGRWSVRVFSYDDDVALSSKTIICKSYSFGLLGSNKYLDQGSSPKFNS